MSRIIIALLAIAQFCAAQNLPAFRWVVEVDGSGSDQLAGLGTDAQGNIYLAGTTRSENFRLKNPVQDHFAGASDVFVTKLDPAGNIVYSTYFGGGGGDNATAMAVDSAGNVYVTGTTDSTDFPTTKGAFSPSLPASTAAGGIPTFVFKLNADGSTGYASYLSNSASRADAIAVDSTGSVYLTGFSYGGMVTTPGAYRTTCTCIPPIGSFSFFSINDAFLTRFDPSGSRLIFSTYIGAPVVPGGLALAPDGSAYLAGAATRTPSDSVFHLDATGTSLIASTAVGLNAQAMRRARDGSIYVAGPVTGQTPFVPTPAAFQPQSGLGPNAKFTQTGVAKLDGDLHGILAATYFGGAFGTGAKVLTLDADGNVYVGGYTAPRDLPARTPFNQGFGVDITGFVAKFNPDLSALLFSSQFGDNEAFGINGLAIGTNGDLVLGGSTGGAVQNVWANSLILTNPPALRIDSVENSSSHFNDPISDGDSIVVQGAGFETGVQVLINGTAVVLESIDSTQIVAIVPPGLAGDAAAVQVSAGSALSNRVLVPVKH